MPVRKPSQVIGFRYVGTTPVTIIGLGDLNPDDIVPVEKAKELFGEDFHGSLVLVPVQSEGSEQQNQSSQGGES